MANGKAKTATRPTDLNIKIWARIEDADRSEAVRTWEGADESDRKDINSMAPDEAVSMLVSGVPGDHDDEPADKGASVAVDAAGTTAGSQVQDIVAKLSADKLFIADMAKGVATALEAKYKVLDFMGHIERLALAGVLPRWEPEVVETTVSGNTLHDAFSIPGKLRKGKRGKGKTGHRLYIIYDQVFGGKAVTDLQRYDGMGKEDKQKMGDDEYIAQKADTRLPLTIGRDYFVDASTATHCIADINRLTGIKVVAMKASDGTTLRSQYPFQLRETDGQERRCRVSIGDLLKYRVEVAETLIGTGEGEEKIATMYDAILASAEKKKRETATEKVERLLTEYNAARREALEKGTNVEGIGLTITNVNQAESAIADLAMLLDKVAERKALLAKIISDKHFNRSAYLLFQALDLLLTPELRQRGAMVDDNQQQQETAAA